MVVFFDVFFIAFSIFSFFFGRSSLTPLCSLFGAVLAIHWRCKGGAFRRFCLLGALFGGFWPFSGSTGASSRAQFVAPFRFPEGACDRKNGVFPKTPFKDKPINGSDRQLVFQDLRKPSFDVSDRCFASKIYRFFIESCIDFWLFFYRFQGPVYGGCITQV